MLLNQEIDNLFIHYFTRFFNVRGRYSFIILILCFINVYNIYIHAYLYNNVCQKVLVVQLYGYGKWRHVHLQFCPYFCACTFIVSVRIIILVFLFLSYNSKMCCIFGVQVFKQTNFSIFSKLDWDKNEQSSWPLSITVTKAI